MREGVKYSTLSAWGRGGRQLITGPPYRRQDKFMPLRGKKRWGIIFTLYQNINKGPAAGCSHNKPKHLQEAERQKAHCKRIIYFVREPN